MKVVNSDNNLIKTLRENPNELVSFGKLLVRYCKIDNEEYLVYENVNDNTINLEQLNKKEFYGKL
tara:strand:+ start:11 stop:205 length:195 start_codon:yes stop_codon:yes gene_type:complete